MARRRSSGGGLDINSVLLIVGIGAVGYWIWTKYQQSQATVASAQFNAGVTQDMSQTAPPASTALILNPSGGSQIFIPGLDTPGSGGYTVAPGLTLPTNPPLGVPAIQIPTNPTIQVAPAGYVPMFITDNQGNVILNPAATN